VSVNEPEYYSNVRKDIIALVPQGPRLLDVGGGTGATALRLKQLGHAQIVGLVDLVAAESVEGLDFCYSGDLTDPALLDRIAAEQGPFDTIVAADVLEHLVDPWTLVKRLHGMLKPGGSLLISVPNVRHHSVSLVLLLRGEWRLRDSGILDRTHLRFFVRETAIELATCSGLHVDRVVPTIQPRRLHSLLRTLFGRLVESLITTQYLVRAVNESPPQSD